MYAVQCERADTEWHNSNTTAWTLQYKGKMTDVFVMSYVNIADIKYYIVMSQ